jgi:hypothetical protein
MILELSGKALLESGPTLPAQIVTGAPIRNQSWTR